MASIEHLKEIAPFIQPESMAVGCSKRRDHFWDLLIAELEAAREYRRVKILRSVTAVKEAEKRWFEASKAVEDA